MAASSSNSIMRFLEESTPGTIASGGPQVYRVSGGTLSQSAEYIEDNQLRSDRGRGEATLVSGTVGGSLSIAYSHKTHDDFLEALLASTFSVVAAGGEKTVSDMAFNATSHTITSATNALPLLEAGQWFKISGANDSDNDGIYKASGSVAPTTGSITVDTAIKDVGATDTASSTEISSSRLKQGNSDLRTFTLERELSDVSQFFTWKGCYVSALSLNYSVGAAVDGSFTFIGTETEEQGTTSKFPGISSAVAATTTQRFNSTTGTYILIDGASLGDSCTESFSIDINAGLREQRCIGSGLSASGVGADQFTISGKLNMFFGSSASAALYQKKMQGQSLSFSIGVTDPDGNGMAITIASAKITEASVDGGSMGSDVMMSVGFSASTDSDLGSMIAIDRLGSVS